MRRSSVAGRFREAVIRAVSKYRATATSRVKCPWIGTEAVRMEDIVGCARGAGQKATRRTHAAQGGVNGGLSPISACPPTGNTANARNGSDPVFDRANVWPAPTTSALPAARL